MVALTIPLSSAQEFPLSTTVTAFAGGAFCSTHKGIDSVTIIGIRKQSTTPERGAGTVSSWRTPLKRITTGRRAGMGTRRTIGLIITPGGAGIFGLSGGLSGRQN